MAAERQSFPPAYHALPESCRRTLSSAVYLRFCEDLGLPQSETVRNDDIPCKLCIR